MGIWTEYEIIMCMHHKNIMQRFVATGAYGVRDAQDIAESVLVPRHQQRAVLLASQKHDARAGCQSGLH